LDQVGTRTVENSDRVLSPCSLIRQIDRYKLFPDDLVLCWN